MQEAQVREPVPSGGAEIRSDTAERDFDEET